MTTDVRQRELGLFGDSFGQNGESRRVCPLTSRPGYLFKEYLAPLAPAEAARLDRLVQLTSALTGEQRDFVGRYMSWPTQRVVNDAGQIVGVLLPAAPASYHFTLRLPSGKTQRAPLPVDLLALPGAEQAPLGLPRQTLQQRLQVCASLASAGQLYENLGLVYLDWNYANAFWSVADHTAFVIDMDGCSFGPRPQLQQRGWDDPLIRSGPAGNESDRFRIALLIGRCLTGDRGGVPQLRRSLSALVPPGAAGRRAFDLVSAALSASSTVERPSVGELAGALNEATGQTSPVGGARPAAGSDTGGVRSWRPIGSKTAGGPGGYASTSRTAPHPAAPKAGQGAALRSGSSATSPGPKPAAAPPPLAGTQPFTAGQSFSSDPPLASWPPQPPPQTPPSAAQPGNQPVKPGGWTLGRVVMVIAALFVVFWIVGILFH